MTEDKYILPVFVLSLQNRDFCLQQIVDKPEFLYSKLEVNNFSKFSVWNAIIRATHISKENDDDLFILATEDHTFTPSYKEKFLIKNIVDGHRKGVDICQRTYNSVNSKLENFCCFY